MTTRGEVVTRSTRTSHRAGKFHRSMVYTKLLMLEAPFGETQMLEQKTI